MMNGIRAYGPPNADMMNMMQQKMFAQADQSKDGKISQDEFVAMDAQMSTAASPEMLAGKPKAEEIFKQIDTDQDGSISRTEFESTMKSGRVDSPRSTISTFGGPQNGAPDGKVVDLKSLEAQMGGRKSDLMSSLIEKLLANYDSRSNRPSLLVQA